MLGFWLLDDYSLSASVRQTIIVYGNCQAGVFHDALAWFGEIKERYDTLYVLNFQHPTAPQEAIPDDDIRRCGLVIEQIDATDQMPIWLRDKLPENVPVIRFPPLDFNLMWPLNFVDPRNIPELPQYPFGQFPYGDRVVVELLRRGLAGEALWTAYLEESPKRIPDLDRLQQMERHRLVERDKRANVQFADLVMDTFAAQPLFWTINHPTGWLLGRALARLMQRIWEILRLPGDPIPASIAGFQSFEPFGDQHTPIHPTVARRLALSWWEPTRRYQHLDGSLLSYEEYMLRYIDFRPWPEDPSRATR
jgi:hypothetical protein